MGIHRRVELRNTAALTVSLDDWSLVACDGTGRIATIVASFVGYSLDRGETLLLTGSGFSGPFGDASYSFDVPDDGGWQLLNNAGLVVDSVGLSSSSTANQCVEPYRVGPAGAPQCDWAAGEAATRNIAGTDTNVNAADFTCQPRTPGRAF